MLIPTALLGRNTGQYARHSETRDGQGRTVSTFDGPAFEARISTTSNMAGQVMPEAGGRVFAPNVLDALNVTVLEVPFGSPEVDVLAQTGPVAAAITEGTGTAITVAAGSFTGGRLNMVTLIAGWDATREVAVRLGGGLAGGASSLEQVLTMDLEAQLTDLILSRVVAGIYSGAPPSTEPSVPGAASTAAAITALYAAAYDGVFAPSRDAVKLVTSPGVEAYMATLEFTATTGVTLAQWAETNFGGVMSSAKVAVASATNTASGFFVLAPPEGRRYDSVLAVENAVEIIADSITDARKGGLHFTAQQGAVFSLTARPLTSATRSALPDPPNPRRVLGSDTI